MSKVNTKVNLLEGDIFKIIVTLSIPVMTSMFLNTGLNVTDTYFAGLYSDDALSALGASSSLYFVITSILMGFASAATALVGNSLGKSKTWLARKYVFNSITITTLVSLFISIIGLLFATDLLHLFNSDPVFIGLGIDYMNVIFFGTIFMSFQSIFNAILVAEGDTKSGRNAVAIAFIANIFFDYLLVPRYGTAGLACATIFVQIISSIYLAKKVQESGIVNIFSFFEFAPSMRLVKQIFEQAIYSSLNYITMALGMFIIMYFIAAYGKDAIASYGVGTRVEQLCLTPVLAFSFSILTIVARNYGAKKYDRTKEVLNAALKIAFAISIIGSCVLIFFGKNLLGMFTNNENILLMGYDYVFTAAFGLMGYAFIFSCVSVLQGLKRPKFIFPLSLFRQIIAPLIIFPYVIFELKLEAIYTFWCLILIVWLSAIVAFLYTRKTMNEVLVKK